MVFWILKKDFLVMSFYRKYRPQFIEELDLESARIAIQNLAADIKKIPHAYLFSGPRGTGKTSAARILAKLVNCEKPVGKEVGGKKYLEPCNKCDQCLSITAGQSVDVIEMDAASNRGIDDIRSLRESVSLSPVSARKKVYIIDESHMLTTEAANAFLKTLEEPPEHVIFILATTEPEKLPVTVISRLSRIDFRKAKQNEISRQLKRLAEREGIDISEDIIALIVEKSDGSFRDAAKVLETLLQSSEVLNLENSMKLLNTNSSINIDTLANLIAKKDLQSVLKILSDYSQSGGSAKDVLDKLIEIFRKAMYSSNNIADHKEFDLNSEEIIHLLELLLEARGKLSFSPDPIILLEIAASKWSGFEEVVKKKIKNQTSQKASLEESKLEKKDLSSDSWLEILNKMKAKNASIETLLRSAKPKGINGDTIKLGVYYRFHLEQLENINYKKTLEEVCSSVLGRELVKVQCSLEERERPVAKETFEPPLAPVADSTIVNAAKDVFS